MWSLLVVTLISEQVSFNFTRRGSSASQTVKGKKHLRSTLLSKFISKLYTFSSWGRKNLLVNFERRVKRRRCFSMSGEYICNFHGERNPIPKDDFILFPVLHDHAEE
jgi:hypothetical protein